MQHNDQPILIHNVLSKSIEEFTPLDITNVKMYWCGPTVYDRAHIGNLRSSVVADLFYRVLRTKYSKVTFVRNYTDIDDKIIDKSKKTNTPITEIVSRATAQYIEDMNWLGNNPPTHTPSAVSHINEMIEMIEKLVSYNYAYVADGHVFFETSLYQEHGKLSNRAVKDGGAESRIGENKLKRNPEDFVLWKPSTDDMPGWESPWGYGRPGWHIECSAMAAKYLGHTFDLHGGGSDLCFPHHDNEIAQSCAAHGTETMANYWVHSGMLNFGNFKMSKSLGNGITSKILSERNVSGDALRLMFLSTHYRSVLNYSDEILDQSRKTLTKWYEKTKSVNNFHKIQGLDEKVKELLYYDLNTPAVITRLHELYEMGNYTELLYALRFLGFKMQPIEYNEKNILELAEKRAHAKLNKNYALSDLLREEIISQGFEVNDTPSGMDVKQLLKF